MEPSKYDFSNKTSVSIYNEDALEALSRLKDNSIDSVVTDPPYGLNQNKKIDYAEIMTAWAEGREPEIKTKTGFAGLEWDAFVPSPTLWKECLRVLKPGGLLVSFAGSRTQGLMEMSIRLAGFQIKDMIAWHKANGFFKGCYLQREAELGGAVNNSIANRLEPITVAQKPPEGTLKSNFSKYGVGGFFFENNYVPRVPGYEDYRPINIVRARSRVFGREGSVGRNLPEGRIPVNIAFSHHDNCLPNEEDANAVFSVSRDTGGCVPGCPVSEMPLTVSSKNYVLNPDKLVHTESRASSKERVYYENEDGEEVFHHTVKPLNLMRWLTRLVTPPGGVTLDPFLGSGTTAEAAVMEGRSCIGSEVSTDYIGLIEKRMERVEGWLETDQ